MNRNYVKIEKPNNLKTKRYIIDNVLPEMVFDNVIFVFGVGGKDKKNSSSWILKKYEQN